MTKMNYKRICTMVFLLMLLAITGCGTGENVNQNNKKEENNQIEQETQSEQSDEDADNSEIQEEDEEGYYVLVEGDIAPEFTAQLADGSTFTLSDNKGKVVLLNFWATWCGPCVGEMPAFEKLYKEYGDDVVILAVNCLENASIVDQFIDESGYTFPIAYDEDGTVNMKYPSEGIPYTVILDKEGVIQYIYVGAADADTQYQAYKSDIEGLLGE